MKYFTARDNRRLARSTLISLGFHAALFIILTIVVAINGVKSQDRIGTITINLESMSRPTRRSTPDKVKEEDKAPRPSPSVKPQPKQPEKPQPSPVVKKKTATTKKAAATTKKTTTTTAKTTSTPKKDPEPAKKPEPTSNLEAGSLSQLDKMLKESETQKATTTSNTSGKTGGGGSSGGKGPKTVWDDNAYRELISQAKPVIPRWVSEQGLRLKVVLAVSLNADGLVTVRAVQVSCGYPDVDAAVAKAVSRWKYTRGRGAQTVRGTITYFIEPK